MAVGIIIGILVAYGLISAMGGVLKKALEIISSIAKFIICGGVALALFELLPWEVEGWGTLLVFLIGGVLVAALILMLVSVFRLVGYSMNFFVGSVILLFVVQVIGNTQLGIIPYALIQFLFPRILWISDRFATSTDYSHTEFGIFSATEVYITSAVDNWGSSADGWNLIPLQILISCIFYIAGSVTVALVCTFDPGWLLAVYIALSTVIGIVFDLLVFRRIEEAVDIP